MTAKRPPTRVRRLRRMPFHGVRASEVRPRQRRTSRRYTRAPSRIPPIGADQERGASARLSVELEL